MAERTSDLEERHRRGADLYDHEIGGVVRLHAVPGWRHSRFQARIGQMLDDLAEPVGLSVGGPGNLGRDGNFVVPDVAVLWAEDEPDEDGGVWLARAAVAVEVLSPREDEAAKLADYRSVIEAGDLELEEVWYLDAEAQELRVYDARSGQRRPSSTLFDLDTVLRDLFGS